MKLHLFQVASHTLHTLHKSSFRILVCLLLLFHVPSLQRYSIHSSETLSHTVALIMCTAQCDQRERVGGGCHQGDQQAAALSSLAFLVDCIASAAGGSSVACIMCVSNRCRHQLTCSNNCNNTHVPCIAQCDQCERVGRGCHQRDQQAAAWSLLDELDAHARGGSSAFCCCDIPNLFVPVMDTCPSHQLQV